MSQHDRRTAVISGDPHVVARLQIHGFIMPPARTATVEIVRWIVDAMNVIGSRPDGWWRDRPGARHRLVERLERWAEAAGHQVIVVFEGPTPIHSSAIRIHHAPKAAANSADDEIVRLVSADIRSDEITVVTSDATLVARIEGVGVSVCPAKKFRDLIDPRG